MRSHMRAYQTPFCNKLGLPKGKHNKAWTPLDLTYPNQVGLSPPEKKEKEGMKTTNPMEEKEKEQATGPEKKEKRQERKIQR